MLAVMSKSSQRSDKRKGMVIVIIMDVSFILSANEIFTLMQLIPSHTEAGQLFIKEALVGAEACDLAGLIERDLARCVRDEISLEPIIRMVADTIALAESAQVHEGVWKISAPWLSLICKPDRYRKGHFIITPVQEL